MALFPFMQNVEGKCFLVVGDGAIAQRKIRFLRQFPCEIRLVRTFEDTDLRDVDYCIASSDDSRENGRIAALCRQAGIPVNVPDDPSACTFFLPALIRRGDLVIAVSTGGESPAMARLLRQQIEEDLPDRTEEILDRMGELRRWIPLMVEKSADRAVIYREILERMMDGRLEPGRKAVRTAAMNLIRAEGLTPVTESDLESGLKLDLGSGLESDLEPE